MNPRNQTLAMGAGIACILGGWLLFGGIGLPGPRSSGSAEEADYCNLLLVPSVAEKIGLDLPLRIRMAKKGARLLYHLRNGSGHMPVILGANKASDRIGSSTLARAGRETREMLPPDSRAKFEEIFSDGDLVRVSFWTEKTKRAGPSDGGVFFITYGWYADEKDRTRKKSLRGCESALDDCYLWISSETEADTLLGSDHKDVRKAAEKWWRTRGGEPERLVEESRRRMEARRIRTR